MPNSKPLIKCIIVDDEPLAREVVRGYVEQTPILQLQAEFGNAVDAHHFLNENNIDLIFLDIRMPKLNGTDLLRSLRHPPKVIFTTAHKEYAADGFELDAVDYLLKPIRFERFLRAISKAFPEREQVLSDTPEDGHYESENTNAGFIYLRADRKMIRVELDDIVYIESAKDYIKVVMSNGVLTVRQTITSIESMLNPKKFLRIHRSFIVGARHIKSYNHELVFVGKTELPIGKNYRNDFAALL